MNRTTAQSDLEVFTTNPPNALLRAFRKEGYARSFIAGKIRFGLLESYRTIEDSRRDEMEGEARFSWKLAIPVHYQGSSVNTRFILCTSHPETDRSVLTERFGPYIVRISDPLALWERINVAWSEHPWAAGRCAIVQVVYNKGELLDPTPDLIAPWHYSFSQKSGLFSVEREFRYVLTCTGDPERVLENALILPLPDCSDICSLT